MDFDVTRIALSELQLVLEEMKDCKSMVKLNELLEDAEDCLSAYAHSLLVRL